MDEIKDPAALAGEPDPGAAIAGDPAAAITAQSPSAAPHHVFLIDGSGFIFRAYFARARDPKVERFQRQSDGTPTEVVMIFSNMLDKYRRETDADRMAVIFDASGTSFRNQIYDQYKANRREMPDDLRPQLAHVRRAADAFDICRIEMDGFEADDLIATYARLAVEAGARVTILSSDKDLMQLVGDRVTMRDPMSDRLIGAAEVREKFGVGPDKVIEVQALCGDTVDNVPGVPGIGVKTAAELINAYGDLETLLARAAEIKQPKRRQALIDNEDQARLSKVLVKLDDDVPVPCPLSALEVKPYDPDKLFPFLDEMELRALKTRIAQRLSVTAPAAAAAPEHPEPVIPQVPRFEAPRSYALIDTAEGLERWIEAAYQAGTIAIWPVTSAVAGARPAFAGIALALSPGLAAYVPLAHRPAAELDLAAPSELAPGTALEMLRPLLADPGVLKIGHDVKAAAHLLARCGIALAPYDCTMLMSYVLDGGQFDHAIESLVRRSFEHELTAQKELIGTGKSLVAFAELAPERVRDFAAERADAALRLHLLLKARLVRDRMTAFYETIERPLVPVVAAMERDGIKVDREALAGLSHDFGQRIAEIETAIYRAVGNDFNIGSTKQLGEVLFDKLGLPGGKKGKTGAYGTDASIL
ncbi:MAG: DNA polymerase, partial [Stellaceae bacterium]